MEEMQNTSEWVQANNYTEGSSITSQENEVTENDSRLEASIYIDSAVMQEYVNEIIEDGKDDIINALRDVAVSEIQEAVMDEIDYDKIAESVLDDISYSDIAREVADDYLDIDDIVEKVNRNIDYADLASEVSDYIDLDDISERVRSDIDLEDTAYDLLNSYTPANACSLGKKFTEAIADAIGYLIETDDDVIARIRNYDPTVSNMTDEQVQEEVSSNVEAPAETQVTAEDETIPAVTIQDHCIEALKKVVSEVLSAYVPSLESDPYMRIRLEAKSFDTFTEHMTGKW